MIRFSEEVEGFRVLISKKTLLESEAGIERKVVFELLQACVWGFGY
jgi:hypothetical protein